jgi:hypothetical protein
MSDIEQKALALVNEIEREEGENELTRRIMRGLIMDEALCRAIEQHEAFRQEVSDALIDYFGEHLVAEDGGDALANLVIPKPKPKPDPLVDIVEWLGGEWTPEEYVKEIRAALDARGLEIREKNDEN